MHRYYQICLDFSKQYQTPAETLQRIYLESIRLQLETLNPSKPVSASEGIEAIQLIQALKNNHHLFLTVTSPLKKPILEDLQNEMMGKSYDHVTSRLDAVFKREISKTFFTICSQAFKDKRGIEVAFKSILNDKKFLTSICDKVKIKAAPGSS